VDISTLATRVADMEADNDGINKEVSDQPRIEAKLKQLEESALKQDIWFRKWNLVVKGVTGPLNENDETTDQKVRAIFQDKLHVDASNFLFQAVHRLPGGPVDKKNIICRFVDMRDRNKVLRGLVHLPPGSDFSVVVDLPPELQKLRNKLLAERSRLPPERKKRTKLVLLKESPWLTLVSRN
jgi:hypothetical protein